MSIKEAIRSLFAEPEPPTSHGEVVVRPTVTPSRLAPRPERRPIAGLSVSEHHRQAWHEREHLRIERKNARAALETLQVVTEQAKAATEYQHALNTMAVAQAERDVRLSELAQRRREVELQRRHSDALAGLRLQKDRTAIQLEIARMHKEMRDLQRPPERQLTPAQERALKRLETEQRLQQLRDDEARALKRAAGELERRRVQNLYSRRQERLMEELEEYL
jgi:hypothetical protein